MVPTRLSRFQEAIFCRNGTVAVAMRFAMKNGQICFSLRKFLAISSAIQKIASDCGCDAVVHLGPEIIWGSGGSRAESRPQPYPKDPAVLKTLRRINSLSPY